MSGIEESQGEKKRFDGHQNPQLVHLMNQQKPGK